MDLKDLANEERVARAHPSRAASPAKQPEPAAKTSWSVGPPGVRWRVLKSRLLDDEPILIVFGKKNVREARMVHPDKVIYFPPEIEELRRHKDAPDYPQILQSIHLIKKTFGAWIIPSDSRLARRLDASQQAGRQGPAKRGRHTR